MSDIQDESTNRPLRPGMRIALTVIGTISVALAVVAALLPVLPSTPFVVIAAVCYGRSSDRLYRRLMSSRIIGENYRNLRTGRGLPLRVKLSALMLAWLMLGFAALFLVENPLIKGFLIALAVVKTVVMFRIRTMKPVS
jgi:hypothetical protein